MRVDKFWIVTQPTPHSTIRDICFSANIVGLANQFRGGLEPMNVAEVFTDETEATALAQDLLNKRDMVPMPGSLGVTSARLPWTIDEGEAEEPALFDADGLPVALLLTPSIARLIGFTERPLEENRILGRMFQAAPNGLALAEHVLAMADDAYLVGHPEWHEIAEEARMVRAIATSTRP